MKTLVIGFGNQGRKRAAILGDDLVGTVDPYAEDANFKTLDEVPISSYEACMVCTPEVNKFELVRKLLHQKKHVLVEKPLSVNEPAELDLLQTLAKDNNVVCYTAYNHRFEPNIVAIRELLERNAIGELYSLRMFYGNGTAQNIAQSPWRDAGSGVLADLGSHLFDLLLYLIPTISVSLRTAFVHSHETKAPDHVLIVGGGAGIAIQCEMTFLSWKNTFAIDLLGAKGSIHMQGLCKWGPSGLTVRERVLPSGAPIETVSAVQAGDPTWIREYEYFRALCDGRVTDSNSITKDKRISALIQSLSRNDGVFYTV